MCVSVCLSVPGCLFIVCLREEGERDVGIICVKIYDDFELAACTQSRERERERENVKIQINTPTEATIVENVSQQSDLFSQEVFGFHAF